MRLFLAIELPDPVRQHLAGLARPLKDRTVAVRGKGISVTRPENLHVTLKFLGAEPKAGIAPLRARLREVAAVHEPVTLTLGGVDAFPNLRAPRIVWMGATAGPELDALRRAVDAACAEFGYAPEVRPFRPHVTLGRVKSRLDADGLRRLDEGARAVRYASTVHVRTVDLMSSTLTPAGSRYAVVQSASLGGA